MARANRFKKGINLGTGFSDSVEPNRSGIPGHGASLPHQSVVGRLLLLFLFFGGFLLLSGRLIYLTVVQGTYYQTLSAENRTREEQIPASRGILYARDGSVLAGNRPIYRQCDMSKTVCRYLSREAALEKEASGESVEVVLGREYPEGAVAAHLVGYMSEVSEAELQAKDQVMRSLYAVPPNKFCQWCYRMGDYIGALGVEKTLETRLRGNPGKRFVEVDATGRQSKELIRVEPVPGENVTLALDIDLQRAGIAALERTRTKTTMGGAIIATKPDTGEVLAFYSSPSFDPNLFVFVDPKEIEEFVRQNETVDDSGQKQLHEELRYTKTSIDAVLSDPERPLFNRVIAGLYPPASTFKLVIAAAALEEGVLNSETTVDDTGTITVGAFSFSNWYFTQYGRTDGVVDTEQALARSNDIFFYKVGEWLGIDNIEKWGRMFGLENQTGIELEGEEPGLIKRDRQWYLGDTYHMAIGQGDLQTTPLQVNSVTQTIANNGIKCRPTIFKIEKDKADCQQIPIKDETIKLVHNGLVKACSDGGTAWPLFNFSVNTGTSSASLREFTTDNENFFPLENGGTKIQIACKTGTGEFGDPENKTHAWLTAYAPASDPEIVITVLVEAGGEGSSVGGPIVRDMMEEWFSKERQ